MCDLLIVDDDDDIRENLATILVDEGYVVDTAANGQAGLERLHLPNPPRLILLDLMMPQMSGWDFRVLQLKEPSIATIPVVVLSGASDLARSAAALNAAGALTKPFRLAELLDTITRLAGPGTAMRA